MRGSDDSAPPAPPLSPKPKTFLWSRPDKPPDSTGNPTLVVVPLLSTTAQGDSTTIHALVDSGAQVNVLSTSAARALRIPQSRSPALTDWKGNSVATHGLAQLLIQPPDGDPFEAKFIVADLPPNGHDAIIGVDTLRDHVERIDLRVNEVTFKRKAPAVHRLMSLQAAESDDLPPTAGEQFTYFASSATDTLDSELELQEDSFKPSSLPPVSLEDLDQASQGNDDLRALLHEFRDVFAPEGPSPGSTTTATVHRIDTGTAEPFRSRAYPVAPNHPFARGL